MRQLTLNDLDELADLTGSRKGAAGGSSSGGSRKGGGQGEDNDSEVEEILGVDKEVNTDHSIVSDDPRGGDEETGSAGTGTL